MVVHQYLKELSGKVSRELNLPVKTSDPSEFDVIRAVTKRPTPYEGIKIAQYFSEYYLGNVDDGDEVLTMALDKIVYHECVRLVEENPIYQNVKLDIVA